VEATATYGGGDLRRLTVVAGEATATVFSVVAAEATETVFSVVAVEATATVVTVMAAEATTRTLAGAMAELVLADTMEATLLTVTLTQSLTLKYTSERLSIY